MGQGCGAVVDASTLDTLSCGAHVGDQRLSLTSGFPRLYVFSQ